MAVRARVATMNIIPRCPAVRLVQRTMSEYVPPTLSPYDLKSPLPEKYSVGTNLKVKAVLFEYGILARPLSRRTPSESIPGRAGGAPNPTPRVSLSSVVPSSIPPSSAVREATESQLNLVSEVSGLMGKARRGLDLPVDLFKDVGRSLTSDLKTALGGEGVGGRPKAGAGSTHPGETAAASTKQGIAASSSGRADIKAKYMEKLREKTGGCRASLPAAETRGDAELLQAARARLTASSAPLGPASAAWLLKEGAGELLLFLAARSMCMGIIAGPGTAPEEFESFVSQLEEQGSAARVAVGPEELEEQGLDACLRAAALKLGVEGSGLMVVSSDDPTLGAGSSAGMYTVRVHKPNTRRGSATANFVIRGVDEVRTAVEEINGVSFRRR
ncbi:unnamed protein product [Discosporangium mesarthrocarpum]